MKKINNIAAIEEIVYKPQLNKEDNIKSLRFVRIIYGGKSQHNFQEFFFYDCLLACIVLVQHNLIYKWNGNSLTHKDFPLYKDTNVNLENKPKFQQKEWSKALENAQEICYFLEKKLFNNSLDQNIINDLHICIANIKEYFCLNPFNTFTNTIIDTVQSEEQKNNISKNAELIINNDFIKNLSSPLLFNDLDFPDKHRNKVYLLLEKIFHNFSILSKYKMQHVYESVQKIDEYLVNHMKNIYFSQSFPMINIEEETISILTKINTYLTQEIDNYLEQCIDNQLLLIDSIHNKFKKVHQI